MRTFAEQIAGLTRRRARRSEPLRAMLTSVGLTLAGRAGVRLAAKVGFGPAVDEVPVVGPQVIAGDGHVHRCGDVRR